MFKLWLAALLIVCSFEAKAEEHSHHVVFEFQSQTEAVSLSELQGIVANYGHEFDNDFMYVATTKSRMDDEDEDYFELNFYALRRDNTSLFDAKTRPAGLEKAAREALDDSAERVVYFTYYGRAYVAKRMQSKSRGMFKQFIVRQLCGMFFPGHARFINMPPKDGHFEAARVKALDKAGMRVPRVALELDDAVVYTYCGTNLRKYLATLATAEQAQVLHRAILDLAEFHRAGQWHGGSQLRNILVSGDHFYRIDFEEDLESSISLQLVQIYDLCQFLSDATKYGSPATGMNILGERLLVSYASVFWTDTHQHLLDRIGKMLRPLEITTSFLRYFNFKDAKRALALAHVLRSHPALST
ncbi:MAG: hypothetical protein Q8J65_03575 [Nitrosomonadales bacterium]|nr:hypothetical protein [Nitrosomonadales bacterium]